MLKKPKIEDVPRNVLLFSKSRLLNFKRYEDKRDLLEVILKNDKSYTYAEVEKLITEYTKKKVN